jgi:uncharacterized protein
MSYTTESLALLKSKAVAGIRTTKNTLRRLGKLQSGKLDKLMEQMHRQEFNRINCLECANCCRSISPAMNDSDIRRMASHCKVSTATFIQKHLMLDGDGDYVFRTSPCPFIGEDNYCAIYDSRPRACREYPHTDRKRFFQILDLTARNSIICPAVFNILTQLGKEPLR